MLAEADQFDETDPELAFVANPGGGAFLRARAQRGASRLRLRLGGVSAARRFVACYRPEPFWMQPRVGDELRRVPRDTQFLLMELSDARLLLLVPLVSGIFKASVEGGEDGALWLVLDSGEPLVSASEVTAAYVALGDDPYALCREGARAVAEDLGTFTLRRDKPRPRFADYFGWCTWDAFYQDVSEEQLAAGLRCFREGGIEPGFVILDDGWQCVAPAAEGAARLASFAANAKFPRGLGACVSRMKREHGVRFFLVWHAIHGYWGGVHAASLSRYGVEDIDRGYSPEVLSHFPAADREYWGHRVGRPALERLARFYDDYHAELRAAGVDGVKVDNQASVEGVARGQGGRVHAMRATRAALESSVARHFGAELINCMSCSSEMFYSDRSAALTRTSTDFWPNRPETHVLHVQTNALVGLWFGELVHPDWDMFQSKHPAAALHAAARAVSGSAVYVSDKPGEHDFELLSELVCSDGRVLRAEGVAVPTRDSLFADPWGATSLLKIVNKNRFGWVIGLFNSSPDQTRRGGLTPLDLPGLPSGEFAIYLKRADRLLRVESAGSTELQLEPLSAEVATFACIERGVAVLGLSNKLNGGAAILGAEHDDDGLELELCDGGQLLVLTEEPPRAVTSNGVDSKFVWHDQRLDVALPQLGAQRVRIERRRPDRSSRQ